MLLACSLVFFILRRAQRERRKNEFIGFFRFLSRSLFASQDARDVHLMLLIYEPVLKTILINVSLKAIELTFFLFFLSCAPSSPRSLFENASKRAASIYFRHRRHATHRALSNPSAKPWSLRPFLRCRREILFRFIDSHATHHRFPQLAYFLCANFVFSFSAINRKTNSSSGFIFFFFLLLHSIACCWGASE